MLEEILLSGFLTLWTRVCDSNTGSCSLPVALTASIPQEGAIYSPLEKSEFSQKKFSLEKDSLSTVMQIFWLKADSSSESLVVKVTIRKDKLPLAECTSYYSKNLVSPFPVGSCGAYVQSQDGQTATQYGLTYSRISFENP